MDRGFAVLRHNHLDRFRGQLFPAQEVVRDARRGGFDAVLGRNLGDHKVVAGEHLKLRILDERRNPCFRGRIGRPGDEQQHGPVAVTGRFHGLVERRQDLPVLVAPRGLFCQDRSRHVLVEGRQPGLGRLAVVARLGHDFGSVRSNQDRVGEGPNPVLDADPRPNVSLILGNALLGQVDHQQDHSVLSPGQKLLGIEDFLLERHAVRAPVAAGEDREHGPAGLLGRGHRLVVVADPAVAGIPWRGGHDQPGHGSRQDAGRSADPPVRREQLKPSSDTA